MGAGLYFAAYAAVTAVLLGLLSYEAGRDPKNTPEYLIMLAIIWPAVLGMAILMAPFLVLRYLGERASKNPNDFKDLP